MNTPANRRDFLKRAALAAGALTIAPAARGIAPPQGGPAPAATPFHISLAEWSFHRALREGKMDHLDFPKAARGYGIQAIELVNQFFKDKAKDQSYLRDFKDRADALGVKILLIMCDDEGALGDADPVKRKNAVENHFKWVEAAKFLGCHSIRVNAHSSGTADEQLERAADGLHTLCEFAAKLDLNVLVENHGGLSSNGKWLVSVMNKVNLPNCGTLPDFGNFTDYDRYQGVADMMPFAKAVSAKSHDFDPSGNETQVDYRRMVKIVLEANYHGHLGIEYEGDKLSEPDGIRATKLLLDKVRADFIQGGSKPRKLS